MLKTPNLLAYWGFEGDATTSLLDTSGNGHNGSLLGTTLPTLGAGHVGSCYQFDGATQAFQAPFATPVTVPTITVAAWIKPSTLIIPSTYRMFWGNTTAASYFALCNSGLCYPFASMGLSVSGQITVNSNVALGANEWHHCAATYDGSVMRIYVDAVLRNSSPTVSGAVSLGGGNTWWGRWQAANAYSFAGWVDEAAIYGVALSATDIQRLMMGLHPLNG